MIPGLEVINLSTFKRNDWLLADTSASSQSLRFIFSLRMNSSFITLRPGDMFFDRSKLFYSLPTG